MRLLALAASLLLSACGASGENAGNVAAPHGASANGAMAMPHDPANPYAASEREMHEGMMAAGAADASEAWTRKMIEHHRGAITMSEALLAQPNPDPEVARMARTTIELQGKEVAEMNALLVRKGLKPQPEVKPTP